MGYQYDDIEDAEEDRAFLERMEQRKRRRMLERKRRERKKRMMKRLFVSGFVGILIIVCIIIAVRKGADTSEKQENISAQESMTESGSEKSTYESGSQESMAESGSEELTSESNAQKSVKKSGSEEIAAEKTAEDIKDAETAEPQIKFEATSDTVNISGEEVISSHAILVDVNTDTIVATKGAHDRIIPASMTKVLTALVAAEAIDQEQLNDTFTMTKDITDYAYVNDCSSVGLLDTEVVTVRDLFYGTILPSGGDAAVALATYVAGSQEAFVDLMNAKLEELGLAQSAHFTNCVGIHDENHYCTVYDMAVIMKAAMQNEWCREVLSAHSYTTTPTTQHPEGIIISNWFLRRIEDKDTGGVVVGGKTGYVTESGSCAASYEEIADGTPYICVTVGSSSSWRCIYDHVEIYNRYIHGGNVKEEE